MPKYGELASEKVAAALHEEKEGTLKSGSTGRPVTSRRQAIAIGLSEARRAGGKVPPAKKAAGNKAAAKKGAAKKSASRTSAAKESQAKKA